MIEKNEFSLTSMNDTQIAYKKELVEHLDGIVPNRYSNLLVDHLLILLFTYGIDPHNAIHEIKCLEGLAKSATKKPDKYRHPPLNIFWHKHFTSPKFLLQNLFLHNADRLDSLITELLSGFITQDKINRFTYEFTHGAYLERARRKKLTGEWIIFGKHNNQNYYLSLGAHLDNPTLLFRMLKQHCNVRVQQNTSLKTTETPAI